MQACRLSKLHPNCLAAALRRCAPACRRWWTSAGAASTRWAAARNRPRACRGNCAGAAKLAAGGDMTGAVLFDLDGTLADTSGDLAAATCDALAAVGLP